MANQIIEFDKKLFQAAKYLRQYCILHCLEVLEAYIEYHFHWVVKLEIISVALISEQNYHLAKC